MNFVYPEISELVAGLTPEFTQILPPEGNHPSGLHCEEYRVQGRWLQIARDPAISEVVEYHWSDEEADECIVG